MSKRQQEGTPGEEERVVAKAKGLQHCIRVHLAVRGHSEHKSSNTDRTSSGKPAAKGSNENTHRVVKCGIRMNT